MKNEINKLITNLKNKDGCNGFDMLKHNKNDKDYFYYYHATGFINENYFSLSVMKFKPTGNIKIDCHGDDKTICDEISEPFYNLNLT